MTLKKALGVFLNWLFYDKPGKYRFLTRNWEDLDEED